MPDFYIRYGLGGSFGGCGEFERVEASNEDEANDIAYECACAEYDNYAGLYGIRGIEDIMEEDQCSEEDAENTFLEEREVWLDFEVSDEEPYE